MSELISNDRQVEKQLTPTGFKSQTSRSIITRTDHSATWPLFFGTDFILATNFNSELEQNRSLKTEERKREKVNWEVKECSRRTAQKGQAKNLHKKDHVYNNCNEIRSRAIKNHFILTIWRKFKKSLTKIRT